MASAARPTNPVARPNLECRETRGRALRDRWTLRLGGKWNEGPRVHAGSRRSGAAQRPRLLEPFRRTGGGLGGGDERPRRPLQAMTSLGIDLLEKAQWECVVTTPGQAEDPDGLAALPATWFSASVPGTVAGALSAATTPRSTVRNYDDEEYWFRCKFTGGAGVWKLTLNGLATIADVWLNGRHLARSENMFRKVECEVGSLEDANVIAIRFSPLSPLLESRRPRPRWKTYMVKNQNLRWVRTSLLGRIPGWAVTPPVVGPWRPITLTRVDPFEPSHVRLRTSCDGDDGIVRATLRFAGGQEGPKTVRLIVGDSV